MSRQLIAAGVLCRRGHTFHRTATEAYRCDADRAESLRHFQRLPCGCPIDSGCTGEHHVDTRRG